MKVKSIQQYNKENPRIKLDLSFRLLQEIKNFVLTSDIKTCVNACFGCAMIIARCCNCNAGPFYCSLWLLRRQRPINCAKR